MMWNEISRDVNPSTPFPKYSRTGRRMLVGQAAYSNVQLEGELLFTCDGNKATYDVTTCYYPVAYDTLELYLVSPNGKEYKLSRAVIVNSKTMSGEYVVRFVGLVPPCGVKVYANYNYVMS